MTTSDYKAATVKLQEFHNFYYKNSYTGRAMMEKALAIQKLIIQQAFTRMQMETIIRTPINTKNFKEVSVINKEGREEIYGST